MLFYKVEKPGMIHLPHLILINLILIIPVIWNGSKFFVIVLAVIMKKDYCILHDGDYWTVKSLQYFGDIMSNYFPEESNESKVSGITKTTVASVLNVDVSLNYYPTELIPTEWWDNLSTQESDTSGREKEYDTRRNFCLKIFLKVIQH